MKGKFFLIWFLFSLWSCSTVHKAFTHSKVNLDSSSVIRSDSIIQKHIDTSKSSSSIDSHSQTIEVNLDNPDPRYQNGDSTYDETDLGIYAHPLKPDYFITYEKKQGEHSFTIHSKQPIKKVIVTDQDDSAYSNFVGGIDSSVLQVTKTDSVHEKKQENITVKTVDRHGLSFGFWIWAIVGGVLIIGLLLLLGWIRKKKKTITDVAKAASDLIP